MPIFNIVSLGHARHVLLMSADPAGQDPGLGKILAEVSAETPATPRRKNPTVATFIMNIFCVIFILFF
jgi:hypothetical protein